MSIRFGGVVIDATDLERLAQFWSSLLEVKITRREDDWISLGPHLALQATPVSDLHEDLWQVWQDPERILPMQVLRMEPTDSP
jgi:Glyoxalase-like domain